MSTTNILHDWTHWARTAPEPDPVTKGYTIEIGVPHPTIPDRVYPLAEVRGPTEADAVAYADLMLAAPRLRAALENMMDCCRSDAVPHGVPCADCWENAKAAIAAATGEPYRRNTDDDEG